LRYAKEDLRWHEHRISKLGSMHSISMLGMWGLAQQPLSLRVGYNDDDKSPARFVALSPSVLTCNQDTLCEEKQKCNSNPGKSTICRHAFFFGFAEHLRGCAMSCWSNVTIRAAS
jgi:hypothetical protein